MDRTKVSIVILSIALTITMGVVIQLTDFVLNFEGPFQSFVEVFGAYEAETSITDQEKENAMKMCSVPPEPICTNHYWRWTDGKVYYMETCSDDPVLKSVLCE